MASYILLNTNQNVNCILLVVNILTKLVEECVMCVDSNIAVIVYQSLGLCSLICLGLCCH